MQTFHISIDGQLGHYPQLETEPIAVLRAYKHARETGESVTILRADGEAEVEFTRVAVITAFEQVDAA